MTYNQNYPGADIWLQYNYSYMKNGERIIPEEFRSQGWFWYSSQLLGWAFRPDQRLRALIDEGMDVTGLGETLSQSRCSHCTCARAMPVALTPAAPDVNAMGWRSIWCKWRK